MDLFCVMQGAEGGNSSPVLDAYPRSRLMPNEGGFLLREGAEVLVLTVTGECILAS